MLLFQTVLNHRRIVLVDFATEGRDGNLHFVSDVSESQISGHPSFEIWRLRFVVAPRASGSLE